MYSSIYLFIYLSIYLFIYLYLSVCLYIVYMYIFITALFVDIHLIFNLVDASTSFRSAESWTPICLPKFNDTGYLHAYVSYLPDNSPACLLLISTDKEKFFELQQCKEKIVEVYYNICMILHVVCNIIIMWTLDEWGELASHQRSLTHHSGSQDWAFSVPFLLRIF